MNGMYIRQLPDDDLADKTKPYLEKALGRSVDEAVLIRIVPLIKERIHRLNEIAEMADFFFTEGPLDYAVDTLLGKKFAGRQAGAAAALERVIVVAEAAPHWTHDALEAAIRPLAEEVGVKAGDLFGVIRVAVTGKTATPPLFETMEILGRDTTLGRLKTALERLR
jgi:glutamyl-tRNA synthetase